ncbi:Repeat-companion domain protein OS=Isosphaera pallida (strain ATCC 43644 / DSM 9630 / IS1B) GN=Isop_0391 PE=4 SV=1: LRR_6 [Gemmata massiliana]|uniref:Repeat-companion domain protein n=1 Tax=Gemmata massiliana TaxID=1210884 RepID=A0A6P2CVN5_9BACT|nr:TIGR02996 domain-containing protein [Gemmata massiliana]VTR93019.1 Repeat-companion domain protein OS=Isosphaera pallida (strain ATCC 43644 / DSM 9630 / IS1B) GN=Isop_0391 PE=4 SV=1: LRR_6 [Gemmata massiliana]
MNDHDALLHAIGEHPEEDTPRLMFADWLEENGQPERADFARNQIELTRSELTPAERHPLVKKNVYYLNNWVPHWKAQLPRIDGIEWGDFNRGLIEEVQTSSIERLIDRAADVFTVPGIHILRVGWLGNYPTRLSELARVSELSRLRALRLVASRANAEDLSVILSSGHLRRLNALDLHGNYANDAVAGDIADGRFGNLTELWLGSNQIGARGARALAASPHLAELRFLDLRNNTIDHAGRSTLRSRFGSKVKL